MLKVFSSYNQYFVFLFEKKKQLLFVWFIFLSHIYNFYFLVLDAFIFSDKVISHFSVWPIAGRQVNENSVIQRGWEPFPSDDEMLL